MLAFISFSREDEALAAKLEQELRRHDIEAWSSLDLHADEDWNRAVNEAAAKADGFIFLLRPGASSNPEMRKEWQNVLRNDWEGTKPFIPIVTSSASSEQVIPPFLRTRRLLLANNKIENLIDRIVYLLQHPTDTIDPDLYEKARQNHNRRREELKEFILALKDNDSSEPAESGAEQQ